MLEKVDSQYTRKYISEIPPVHGFMYITPVHALLLTKQKEDRRKRFEVSQGKETFQNSLLHSWHIPPVLSLFYRGFVVVGFCFN